MSTRGARRYVADLLRDRRPRSFPAQDADVERLRAAITLRAGQPGSAAPREEFVTDLHRRLAAQLTGEQTTRDVEPVPPAGPVVDSTRRLLVAASSIAAAAAAVGAVVDHTLTSRGRAQGGAGGDQTLTPNTGQWHTVSTSTDLAEGGVQGFDLGSVIGFVTRTAGHVGAVSGVCTHQGCRLALDAAARRLDCPCHNASFAVSGELLAHQLPVPPRALPQLQVRETHGDVQVYAPPGPVV
jgi:nitrite reductase/ring-hydroxylating ferredoxin subunit